METRPLEIKYRDEEDEVAPAWQLGRKGGYDRNRSTRLSLLENNESLFIRRRFSMIRVGFERRFARRLRNGKEIDRWTNSALEKLRSELEVAVR